MDRLETRIDELTAHMNARFAQVDVRFDAVERALISLQTQMLQFQRETLSRFDELGRHMRVLHEDVIDRISKLKG